MSVISLHLHATGDSAIPYKDKKFERNCSYSTVDLNLFLSL